MTLLEYSANLEGGRTDSVKVTIGDKGISMNKPQASRIETLTYLQSMICELRRLAEGERLTMASYFLAMAYTELSDTVREEQSHKAA